MDKYPSIIILGRQFQICSDIFLEKYTCTTVDVYEQIMKAQVDILSTNDLVSSLCVYEMNMR